MAWLYATALWVSTDALADSPRIAIIIDDIGYSLSSGERAIALPGPVALAVLPFTPNGSTLAARANAAQKDVILHQPMEPDRGPLPGPRPHGMLTASMDAAHLKHSLREALAAVPFAVGVSNHTGSLLTTRAQSMIWVMEEVRAHGLFFLDSRTTHETVARDIAGETGVPNIKRDVFLDHVVHPEAIGREYERALRLARRQGHVVIIGHPHDATLDFLEASLPGLGARGFDLVPVRDLLELPRRPATLARL